MPTWRDPSRGAWWTCDQESDDHRDDRTPYSTSKAGVNLCPTRARPCAAGGDSSSQRAVPPCRAGVHAVCGRAGHCVVEGA